MQPQDVSQYPNIHQHGPATEAQLESLYGLDVDGAGNLYIADQENAIIRIVDSAGIIRTL
jgi:meiotically up-regulated gene 157 (Mug157) protein